MTKANTPSASTSEAPATPTPSTAATRGGDRRADRIADYLAAALNESNPLIANVGAINGDLMQYQYYLRRMLDESLTETTPSPADLPTTLHGFSESAKLVKWIDRFTYTEIRLKAEEREAARLESATETASDAS